MNVVYYFEVNLICIAILLLVRSRLHTKSSQYSTDKLVFNALIWATVALCAADLISGSMRGMIFPGARIILEAANLIFFEELVIIGFMWALYVRIKLGLITDLSWKKMIVPSIPMLVFTAVAITNPFTHFLFTIDSANVYARGPGVLLHWVVSWMYLIIPTVRVAVAVAKAPNRMKKKELLPMLVFIAAPVAASLAQMLRYGITSTQVGITFSILMIFILTQDEQILTDPLTGLNNRGSFDNYIADRIARHPDTELTILMLDLNRFKEVNDRFGHIVGDRALVRTARILKKTCSETRMRLFLCRYGGDEFLLCGDKSSKEDLADLVSRIHAGFGELTDEPYELSVSIGRSSGVCTDFQSAEALIRMADEDMYREKLSYAESAAQSVRRR